MSLASNFTSEKTIKNKKYESNDYVNLYAIDARHGNGK